MKGSLQGGLWEVVAAGNGSWEGGTVYKKKNNLGKGQCR